ncbi:ECF-type sigma factor [bacterium]|jgi:RNA polymerase sigma factor (TIGR02999 family)|nr:RNA polymerase subunit sigma [Verrucomicrobiota bacterium]MDA7680198.1 ECF-type sigma factor [bacterium]
MKSDDLHDLTKSLNAVDGNDPDSAQDLLPKVYAELRRLASSRMAQESPGQTLQPTALVHEAYIRITGNQSQQWADRRHFFASAAEAMRRILIENARRKKRIRHGGGLKRVDIEHIDIATSTDSDLLLAVNEALVKLEKEDPKGAELIKLRFFVGLTNVQAAKVLELSERTAKRTWAYARAWLFEELRANTDN